MVLLIPDDERALFEDVLGSGGIFRRMVKTNPEGGQAEFGEEVTIRYSEHLLETDKPTSQDQVREFRIGDGEVMPALELCGKMMRVGEVCEIRCDPRFAYGDKGLAPHVPPNAPMKILLELLRVGKRITAEMTSKELLVEAGKKKESGNRYFKEQKYDRAANLYKKALKILESWERSGESEEADAAESAECKELLVALGNNVANVQHKLQQYKEAKQSSLEVLQLDPKNVKAIYRLAQISLDESEFSDASMYLKQALKLEPNNSKFRSMVSSIKAKKELFNARQKKLYSKLAPSSKKDSPAAATETEQLPPARQFIRSNISIISTLLTAVIAMIIFKFVGFPANQVPAVEESQP
ncbi:hypothetical protein Poli38472_012127 [Pythium oligandrum]|uniref:peptidylprolyl isomerase n=1 Tax=Pythium oligandrum TaxID=41045 RepID=A0A8K1CNQ6_PYTOL|nr:hypothetical protein Poli38472_012127 [Pythium oligandrum]|eukprot:TMW67011.1 hypothetical protein Poli38472_012127 [Pythium oligandrum]